MNPKSIIKKLSQKKVQDYTFTILFFLIFSFFVLGAIRPNILTAVKLQEELKQLREMDKKYEQLLMNIVDNQTVLEANRDNFYLLDEAVPQSPQVYKLIEDVRTSASESGVILENVSVAEISLKSEEKAAQGLTPFILSMEVRSSLSNTQQFVQNLINQRRLKVVNSMRISTTQTDGEVATLQVEMEIQGYHSI